MGYPRLIEFGQGVTLPAPKILAKSLEAQGLHDLALEILKYLPSNMSTEDRGKCQIPTDY